MVISLMSAGIGLLLGFLTGLGTGGGSLLILWLTLVCHMEPHQAKLINLMFFIPSALSATLFRICRNHIPWKKLILPTLSGCVSAAVFSLLAQQINTSFLQKPFGLVLIYIGIRELCHKKEAGS